jgi:hypothetical protein
MDKQLSPRTFVTLACLCFFLPLLLSAGMIAFHIPTNKNQVVIWRQLEKLANADPNIDTVILGDSSAGMAIDAARFSELTGTNTLNLATTAAFGIYTNVLMLAQAKRALPNLRHVYFVVSSTSWPVDFEPEAYHLFRLVLGQGADPFASISEASEVRKNYINWLFTPMRFFWLWRDQHEPPYERGVWDDDLDYIIQGPRKQESEMPAAWAIYMRPPDEDKLAPYLAKWAELCDPALCMIAPGPIYDRYAQATAEPNVRIEQLIRSRLGGALSYKEAPYIVPGEMLGDAPMHVRPEKREETTSHYARIFLEATRASVRP